MRIKAVDKEHEQLKKDRADMVDRFDAALRRAKADGVREASKMADEYGAEEWSNTCVQDGMARLSLRLDARAAQIEEGEEKQS
jgi:hypothetical protein